MSWDAANDRGFSAGARSADSMRATGAQADTPSVAGRPGPDAPSGAGVSRLQLSLRAAAGDFVLVWVLAVCLVLTASYAFESAPDVRDNVGIVGGICAAMLAILYAGSWSKRAAAVSAAGAVAFAVAVVGVCAALTPADVPLFVDAQVNDVAENYTVFGVVSVVVPAACYLLSRRKVGMVLLVAATALCCGVVQFLYRDWATDQPGTVVAVVALLACGALFVFQGYRRSIYAVKRLEKTDFRRATLFALGIAGVCVAVSAVVFFGVVAQLGASTPEIKPFEDYYFRPTVEYSGVYSEDDVENPDETTSNLNDEDDTTEDDAEGQTEDNPSDDESLSGSSVISTIMQQIPVLDPNAWSEQLQAVNYEQLQTTLLVVLLLVVLVIVAAVLAWRAQRERRLRIWQAHAPCVRVWELYEFLVGRLARLGHVRPETLTLMEYAVASRSALAPYVRGTGGVDWLAATLIYQRACYDEGRLTEDDWQALVRLYRAFYKNAYRQAGPRRWIILFWRL